MARYHYAAADLRLSNVGAAIPAYRDGVTAFEAAYGKQGQTHTKAMLAEVTLRSGAVDDALQLLDEVIEQIERPGWEERLYYAETLRLRGCALLLKGDPEGAERNFRLSLEVGPPPTGEILGTAHCHQPRAAVAGPGQVSTGI
jgi:ATP/maltotriose-dependent transcriptional regulator MalT